MRTRTEHIGIHYSFLLFWTKYQLVFNYKIMMLWCQEWTTSNEHMNKNKQTKTKTWCFWTEVRVSSHMSLSSSTHAAFRSIWNLARRLRWSEGNMSLGRPFIDHKTSSDRREREPISFKPSLTKPLAAEEKREKKTTLAKLCTVAKSVNDCPNTVLLCLIPVWSEVKMRLGV